jgi:hypothetical protein
MMHFTQIWMLHTMLELSFIQRILVKKKEKIRINLNRKRISLEGRYK